MQLQVTPIVLAGAQEDCSVFLDHFRGSQVVGDGGLDMKQHCAK